LPPQYWEPSRTPHWRNLLGGRDKRTEIRQKCLDLILIKGELFRQRQTRYIRIKRGEITNVSKTSRSVSSSNRGGLGPGVLEAIRPTTMGLLSELISRALTVWH
jgi:hypothetical protein